MTVSRPTERAARFESPIGVLHVIERENKIIRLDWVAGRPDGRMRSDPGTPSPLLAGALDQLAAYFAGRLRRFDLPLEPEGSAFQRRVWRALAKIPYGETRSYGDIARALGTAPRPVGGACGRNPLPIFIPCHRVLAGHSAGGYSGAGGPKTKSWLLRHEGVPPPDISGGRSARVAAPGR